MVIEFLVSQARTAFSFHSQFSLLNCWLIRFLMSTISNISLLLRANKKH